MQIGMVTSSKKPLTYEDGVFAIDGETLPIHSLLEYDSIGALTWASDDTRTWVFDSAAATPENLSPTQQAQRVLRGAQMASVRAAGAAKVAVDRATQNARPAAAAAAEKAKIAAAVASAKAKDLSEATTEHTQKAAVAASEAAKQAAVVVSDTARTVAENANTEPRRRALPLWATILWAASMLLTGGALALMLALVPIPSVEVDPSSAAAWLKTIPLVGPALSLFGPAIAGLWQVLGVFLVALGGLWGLSTLLAVGVPAIGIAHGFAKKYRNKYGRFVLTLLLTPIFSVLLLPLLGLYTTLCLVLGFALRGVLGT